MTAELIGLLEKARVAYELVPHARTETALAEAAAVGVGPGEVAKTLVVSTPVGNLRAVLPASERLDVGRLARSVGLPRKRLHLLTEADLEHQYPEFELGSVPPLGGTRPDRVVVDSRLTAREWVVLEAGSHEESLRVRAVDLVELAQADVADICRPHG